MKKIIHDTTRTVKGLTPEDNIAVSFAPEVNSVAAYNTVEDTVGDVSFVFSIGAKDYTDVRLTISGGRQDTLVAVEVVGTSSSWLKGAPVASMVEPTLLGFNRGRVWVDYTNYSVDMEFTIKDSKGANKRYKYKHTASFTGDSDEVKSFQYAPGTAAKAFEDKFMSMLVGYTGTKGDTRYVQSHSGDPEINPINITLNPDRFFANMDTSGSTVAQGGKGSEGLPYHLISPRHCMYAEHVGASVNRLCVWKRPDGSYAQARIAKIQSLVLPDSFYSPSVSHSTDNAEHLDMGILYFDREIEGVTIYPVMPPDFHEKYTPLTIDSQLVPSFGRDRNTVPYLRLSRHFQDDSGGSCGLIENICNHEWGWKAVQRDVPIQPEFIPFSNGTEGGDSSGGIYACLPDDTVVLMGALHSSADFESVYPQTDYINTVMNDQADNDDPRKGEYALKIVDLAPYNFTDFTDFDYGDYWAATDALPLINVAVNGDFTSDVSDWVAGDNTTLSWVSGSLRIHTISEEFDTVPYATATQQVMIPAGTTVNVKCQSAFIADGGGTLKLWIGTTPGAKDLLDVFPPQGFGETDVNIVTGAETHITFIMDDGRAQPPPFDPDGPITFPNITIVNYIQICVTV